MLSKEEIAVLDHYLREGLPKALIARKLGISRKTVQRRALERQRPHGYRPRPPLPNLLDPYKEYIKGRLLSYPELTATRLCAEITGMGFKGKYSTVKRMIHRLRPEIPIPIELRFEVNPGHQAQADFATFTTDFGKVHALLVVLSWSRYLWVHFYGQEDQLTVLNGLHRAFLSFGGVPHTLLFDRMKTAVASSDADGQAVFNDEMLRFASHYGFKPTACRPHRPKTKGRVERAVSYLRRSFFYGRRFRDLDDLNHQADHWLAGTANVRIHGTTGEIPGVRLDREKDHLLPLPPISFIPMISLGRKISHDGYVSYNGNLYSVPEGVTRDEILVRATLEEVCFYQGEQLVARHPVLEGRGKRRLAPEHRRNLRLYLQRHEDEKAGLFEFIDVQRRPLEIYEGALR